VGGPIFRSGPNAAASIAPTLIRHCPPLSAIRASGVGPSGLALSRPPLLKFDKYSPAREQKWMELSLPGTFVPRNFRSP